MRNRPSRIAVALAFGFSIALGSVVSMVYAVDPKPPHKDPKPTTTSEGCRNFCNTTPIKSCDGGTCQNVSSAVKAGGFCECNCLDRCDSKGAPLPRR